MFRIADKYGNTITSNSSNNQSNIVTPIILPVDPFIPFTPIAPQYNMRVDSILETAVYNMLDNPLIATINQVPGMRRIFQSSLLFFINLDHLWLYNYHQRNYTNFVQKFLKII